MATVIALTLFRVGCLSPCLSLKGKGGHSYCFDIVQGRMFKSLLIAERERWPQLLFDIVQGGGHVTDHWKGKVVKIIALTLFNGGGYVTAYYQKGNVAIAFEIIQGRMVRHCLWKGKVVTVIVWHCSGTYMVSNCISVKGKSSHSYCLTLFRVEGRSLLIIERSR